MPFPKPVPVAAPCVVEEIKPVDGFDFVSELPSEFVCWLLALLVDVDVAVDEDDAPNGPHMLAGQPPGGPGGP